MGVPTIVNKAVSQHLVGPDYFRQQASAARAWHADLSELAVRQADRCHPTRERAEQDREDGHER